MVGIDNRRVAFKDSFLARVLGTSAEARLHLRWDRLVVGSLTRPVGLTLNLASVRICQARHILGELVTLGSLAGSRASHPRLCFQLKYRVVFNLDHLVALEDDLLELCNLIA